MPGLSHGLCHLCPSTAPHYHRTRSLRSVGHEGQIRSNRRSGFGAVCANLCIRQNGLVCFHQKEEEWLRLASDVRVSHACMDPHSPAATAFVFASSVPTRGRRRRRKPVGSREGRTQQPGHAGQAARHARCFRTDLS